MIHPDLALVLCAFDEVPPLLESLDDCQHFLVMDLIVLLDRGQGLGEEGNQVSLFIFQRHLEEDSICCKVRAVGFDAEGLGQVGRDENWSGGDTLLQPSGCSVFSLSPVPTRVVLGQVEEQVGVVTHKVCFLIKLGVKLLCT